MSPDENRLPAEILKLLFQVAWADDELTEGEIEHLWGVARSCGVSEADMQALTAGLLGHEPLPPPDLGYLRAYKQQALEAAEAMILADRHVAEGELMVLEQIREMLEG